MLEAKWNQFKDTSNIFDEADNSSNESTSSNDGQNEKKFELSKSAGQINLGKEEFSCMKDKDLTISGIHNNENEFIL